MKAVVWSDAVQICLMIFSLAVLVIKGAVDVGIENVWERNLNSGRLEFFKQVLIKHHHNTNQNDDSTMEI